MSTRILVVAEHAGGILNASTAKSVRCAMEFPDAQVTVAVFASASSAAEIAEAAATTAGVDAVILVEDPAHAHPLAAVIAPQLAELASEFSHVLGPSSTFGRDLMPRVAALLGVAQVSDVIEVLSVNRFRRPVYAGNAVATVEVLSRPVVATVRIASYAAVDTQSTAAPVRTIARASNVSSTRFVSLQSEQGTRPDLQSAHRVVAGGRGMGSAGGFRRLDRIADLLGAAIGATRAAVDSGFAPNELQVGQTGKVIAPELYFAFGISGAIQHLAGIKDARTVVAINRDSEAPIFEFADIGLVADIDVALPELEALLERSLSP